MDFYLSSLFQELGICRVYFGRSDIRVNNMCRWFENVGPYKLHIFGYPSWAAQRKAMRAIHVLKSVFAIIIE